MNVGLVQTVNLGSSEPNPHKDTGRTGINKLPVAGLVEVRSPGAKLGGLGSGLVGDAIEDRANHGGDDQAVYAVAREELDRWQTVLGRELRNGMFGENLTTVGVDVDDAIIGEVWQVGPPQRAVQLKVTCPRIPCATFRGFLDLKGWLKTFTAHGRPGAYLSVVKGGQIQSGDEVVVLSRPEHGVSIAECFRSLTIERGLLPGLLRAGADLPAELAAMAAARQGFDLGTE